MILRCILILLLFVKSLASLAQNDTASFSKADSIPANRESKFTGYALILPAVLITYGTIALNNPSLQSVDQHIRKAIWLDHPHGQLPIDDYLQYSPGAAVYILNACGVHGKNNFRDF